MNIANCDKKTFLFVSRMTYLLGFFGPDRIPELLAVPEETRPVDGVDEHGHVPSDSKEKENNDKKRVEHNDDDLAQVMDRFASLEQNLERIEDKIDTVGEDVIRVDEKL